VTALAVVSPPPPSHLAPVPVRKPRFVVESLAELLPQSSVIDLICQYCDVWRDRKSIGDIILPHLPPFHICALIMDMASVSSSPSIQFLGIRSLIDRVFDPNARLRLTPTARCELYDCAYIGVDYHALSQHISSHLQRFEDEYGSVDDDLWDDRICAVWDELNDQMTSASGRSDQEKDFRATERSFFTGPSREGTATRRG
jgi:hypothetical protein